MRKSTSREQQASSGAKKTMAMLGKHVAELTSHAIDAAEYNKHGHWAGSQGHGGHTMPPSQAHLQNGQFIPQAGARIAQSSARVSRANTTTDYGSGDIGYGGRGSFSSGGAAGADYQTTSVGGRGDADSEGPTRF